jgi:multiple sugar transport system ATP-binding protein
MIYVTHDQEEAMAMADRIAVMSDGDLRQIGAPEEIYHRPVDIFVAGFVGEPAMNFLKCQQIQADGQRYLQAAAQPDIRIALPDTVGDLPPKVTLGIRPFYIDLALERNDQHYVPGVVYVVEPLGDTVVVTLTVADARMQVVTKPGFWAEPQQPIWLALNPAHVLLFDDASEKTILHGLGTQSIAI